MSAILVSLILAQLILLYSRRHSSATRSSIASYRFLLDVDGEFVGKNSSTSLSMTSLTSIFSWRDDDGTDVTCFRSGVENHQDGGLLGTQLRGSGRCRCRKGWYGRGCSVPEVVWRGGRLHPFPVDRLTLRHRPRRVVNAMPFNIEFDLLDIRLAELGDVVDVFLILESNFTQYGDHKPFKLRDKLRTSGCGGYDVIDDHRDWRRHCKKIVIVELGFFLEEARSDGWIAERLLRDHLGKVGLSRVPGLRRSDLFLLSDADELPSKDVVEFLRWHDGYTQPVTLLYSWSIFNFGWGRISNGVREASPVSSVVTIGFLNDVLEGHAYDVRAGQKWHDLRSNQLSKYIGQNATPTYQPWTLGLTETPTVVTPLGTGGSPSSADDDRQPSVEAGWHCSWCLSVDGIRVKLTSAQNGDFPRWGDYPDKLESKYIARLVACGLWFDDITRLSRVDKPSVPSSVRRNPRRFSYLLASTEVEDTTNSCFLTSTLGVVATPTVNIGTLASRDPGFSGHASPGPAYPPSNTFNNSLNTTSPIPPLSSVPFVV